MWKVWETEGVHTGVWWRNLRKGDHLGDIEVDVRKIKKLVQVKCTLVQALRLYTGRTVHRGSRGIALLYRH
jgi:hypothetical protein